MLYTPNSLKTQLRLYLFNNINAHTSWYKDLLESLHFFEPDKNSLYRLALSNITNKIINEPSNNIIKLYSEYYDINKRINILNLLNIYNIL